MELKEFEYALKRGLGRCINALEEDASKYRNIVEKYITKCLSFDPIFEGTRSTYMYKILSFYNDKEYFYNMIANEFKLIKFNNTWDFHYLSEMLVNFENDGFEEAKTLLWEKYDYLYNYIYNKKKNSKGIEKAIQCYEMICLEVSFDFDSYFKVAKDIGALIINNNTIKIDDFSWLCGVREEYSQQLVEYEEQYIEIKTFIDSYIDYQQRMIQEAKNPEFNKDKIDDTLYAFSKQLAKQDLETQKDFAYKYLEAKSDEDKIKYLKCFIECEFPLLPEFIIDETKSENKELKEVAYKVLSIIKNETVRNFAISEIKTNLQYVFPLLITNYDYNMDKEMIIECVKKLNVCENDKTWLNNYNIFLTIFDDEENENLPYEALPYMYEKTLCSYVRGFIFDKMFQHNYLSDKILKECLEDCNSETRDIAQDISQFKSIIE